MRKIGLNIKGNFMQQQICTNEFISLYNYFFISFDDYISILLNDKKAETLSKKIEIALTEYNLR